MYINTATLVIFCDFVAKTLDGSPSGKYIFMTYVAS